MSNKYDIDEAAKVLYEAKLGKKKWTDYVSDCEKNLLKAIELKHGDTEFVGTWNLDEYKLKLTQKLTYDLNQVDIDWFNQYVDHPPLKTEIKLDQKSYNMLDEKEKILKEKRGKISIAIEKKE